MKDETKCPHCKGRGTMSKYDQGWRSLVHNPDFDIKRTCFYCAGRGTIPAVKLNG